MMEESKKNSFLKESKKDILVNKPLDPSFNSEGLKEPTVWQRIAYRVKNTLIVIKYSIIFIIGLVAIVAITTLILYWFLN